MKKINFLLLTIISLILLVSVNAATVSHPASEIAAGTFGDGDYIFPNNLVVIGDIKIKTSTVNAILKIDSVSSYSAIDFYDNGNNVWGIGKNPSNKFYISEFGQGNRLVISPGGNVGIGTDSPNAKLDVDGGVKVKSYTTKPSCNSNTKGMFVFDDSANKPYVCANSNQWKPLDSDFDEDGLIDWLDPNDNSFNAQCSSDNGGQCYLSQGSKSGLDADLAAENIKSGVNIFGVTGSLPTGQVVTIWDGIERNNQMTSLYQPYTTVLSASVPSDAKQVFCHAEMMVGSGAISNPRQASCSPCTRSDVRVLYAGSEKLSSGNRCTYYAIPGQGHIPSSLEHRQGVWSAGSGGTIELQLKTNLYGNTENCKDAWLSYSSGDPIPSSYRISCYYTK